MLPPTAGKVTIFGRDVSTDLTTIRKDLGVCPQHVSGGGGRATAARVDECSNSPAGS
jgi:ABC-type multidrug transport system ATPase subunit